MLRGWHDSAYALIALQSGLFALKVRGAKKSEPESAGAWKRRLSMVVTVFRSRVRADNAAEYMKMAEKMKELAVAMPGYIEHKAFTAEDGERCTIVTFESEETHRAWAELPAHRKAQQLGRERFYSEFSIHVCKPTRSNSFKMEGRP